jgi:hypothetical protein
MFKESRPESPELDKLQMADLRDFFSKRSLEEIEKDFQQLTNDCGTDKGPYSAGGIPANAAKAYILIQDILAERENKGMV